MSRQKRLGRLEQQRDQTKPRAVRIILQPHSSLPVPESRGDDAEPGPQAPAVTHGQRPRRPTDAERVAALEILRARARLGEYVGVLPASEAEIRAEQERRGVLNCGSMPR